MHINNISQKAASFILHKRFHPGNYKNMEKVWLAEQRIADDARKETELQHKRIEELRIKELRKHNEPSSNLIHPSIQWVYAHEENQNRAAEKSAPASTEAPTQKRPARTYVLDEPSKYGKVDESDLVRKLKDDPLMLVKKAQILRSRQVNHEKHKQSLRRPEWDQEPKEQNFLILSEGPDSDLEKRKAHPPQPHYPRDATDWRDNEDEGSDEGRVTRSGPYEYRHEPSSENRRAVRSYGPRRRKDASDDSSDESLGPPQAMRTIIKERHSENVKAKLQDQSSRSDSHAEDDSLEGMLKRGRDVQDERACRMERLKLLEQRSEEQYEKQRLSGEGPGFVFKLHAQAIEAYDRDHALRKTKLDPTVNEDNKYYGDPD